MSSTKLLLLATVLYAIKGISTNSSTSVVQECCRYLSQQLPNKVLYPGTEYDKANIRWSVTAMLHPSCIVQPDRTADVSKAIIVLIGGVDNDTSACPFAIKSGGHTPTSGANDIDDGITLDLRYINETTLANDTESMTLGVGSTWLDAYIHLNNTGVTVPGGRYGLVGVGGITLGGGLSFISPKVGWVTDNVINLYVHLQTPRSREVVLASGRVVNANSTSHPDLWLALKGGSGNFGIVTRIQISTLQSDDKWWGGSVTHPKTANTTSQVLSALSNFTANNYLDQNAAFNVNFIYNSSTGEKEIANTLVYTKDVANPPIFHQAQSIQPQLDNSAASTTNIELAANIASLPYGYRYGGAVVNFKNTPEALATAQTITDDIYATVAHVPDMRFTFVYEPVPRVYAEHSIARGGNVMGMDDVQDDMILLLLIPRWSDAKYDDTMNAAFVSWTKSMEEANTILSTFDAFIYLNYAAPFQDPLGSYGGKNVAHMKAVAKKYDPNAIFQTLVPGGFKISKA